MSSVLESSHCNRQPHSGYEHIFLPRRRRRLQLFPHIGTGNRQHKKSRDGRDSVAHRPPCRGDQAAVEACGNGCQGGQGSHVVVHAFCQTHRRSRVSPCQDWKLFWRIMSLPVLWSPSVCLHWFTQTNTQLFQPSFFSLQQILTVLHVLSAWPGPGPVLAHSTSLPWQLPVPELSDSCPVPIGKPQPQCSQAGREGSGAAPFLVEEQVTTRQLLWRGTHSSPRTSSSLLHGKNNSLALRIGINYWEKVCRWGTLLVQLGNGNAAGGTTGSQQVSWMGRSDQRAGETVSTGELRAQAEADNTETRIPLGGWKILEENIHLFAKIISVLLKNNLFFW